MNYLKKTTAVILAIAMLVISGCSAQQEENAETQITETSTESQTDSTITTTSEETATQAVSTSSEIGSSSENTVETTAPDETDVEETTVPASTTSTVTTAAQTEAVSAENKTVTIHSEKLSSDVEKIVSAMGAGWNLGNSFDACSGAQASETAWGNPKTTKELIHAIKAAGFKTIRIPVTYIGRADDAGTIDKEWLDRIQTVVDYAMNEGLYVIINIHHDAGSDGNAWLNITAEDQEPVRTKFKGIWKQISERFKDYSDKLIFESMNEVMEKGNYSTNLLPSTYPNINELNQIFVDTVRATGGTNASRWLLVPGYNTNIDAVTSDIGFILPKDSAKNRLMVSVHFYDPYDLCLNENKKIYKWGNDAEKGGKTNWGHEDYVEQQFGKIYAEFTSQGVPVVLGEYGIIDKSYVNEMSYQYRRYYLEYVAKCAVNHGMVPVYWDNGYDGNNGFAIINRKTATVLYPELVDAIVRGADRNDYEIEIPYTGE